MEEDTADAEIPAVAVEVVGNKEVDDAVVERVEV